MKGFQNARRLLWTLLIAAVVGGFAPAVHAQSARLTDDAYTQAIGGKGKSPSGTNFGGAQSLLIDAGSGARAWLKFDVPDTLPAGVPITQARLRLWTTSVATAGNFDVRLVNSSWTEGVITDASAPGPGSLVVAAPIPVGAAQQFIDIDITSAVEAWRSGAAINNGLALVPSTGSAVNASFDAKESTSNSHAPELLFILGDITAVNAGSGLSGGGAVGDVTLGLASCPLGKILKSTGLGSWSCADDNTSAGGTGTVTSIAAGTGLKASTDPNPITTTGTLSFDSTFGDGRYAQKSGLDKETAARQAADTTLQNNINNEATARQTVDVNETAARQAADATLQNNINTEATARQAGDAALLPKAGGTMTGKLTLDASGAAGQPSVPIEMLALSLQSAVPINQTFQMRTDVLNNNTGDASGRVSVLYGKGATTPTATGIYFRADGKIEGDGSMLTNLPGGDITAVNTALGAGLTGGAVSGDANLSLVPCTDGQILKSTAGSWGCAADDTSAAGAGDITAVIPGTGLTGGATTGDATLNIDTTKVPQLGTANSFIAAQTVNIATGSIALAATHSATDGAAEAVRGVSLSVDGVGVHGVSDIGILGESTTPTGTAIFGLATGAGVNYAGYFRNSSTAGFGVLGVDTAFTGDTVGGYFQSNSSTGAGVKGIAFDSGTGVTTGGYFLSNSLNGRGVVGEAAGNNIGATGGHFTSTGGAGVYAQGGLWGVSAVGATGVSGTGGTGGSFQSNSDNGIGVRGVATDTGPGITTGGYFESNSLHGAAVVGVAQANSISATGGIFASTGGLGIRAQGGTYGVSAVGGQYGVYADGGLTGTGIYAKGGAYSGYFESSVHAGSLNSTNLNVTGTKNFKIDHPLDPANKYLFHAAIESPDVMNLYNGNVVTDDNGEALVVLPDYFQVLNRDFRYQLTPIGQFAQVIVSKEIENGRFTIQSDKPNVKVSWQVTGVRQDPYMEAHRMQVEQDKPSNERGFYLYPEGYGQPKEKSIEYTQRPPELSPASTPAFGKGSVPALTIRNRFN